MESKEFTGKGKNEVEKTRKQKKFQRYKQGMIVY
jgi:hypothetical protein